MDFKQLESFLAVVRYGSFSKAASEMYLTQPTISNHVKTLEEELSLTLLKRSSWGVSLTDEGESFAAFARKILETRHDMLKDLEARCLEMKGTLELWASSIPESYILPKKIADFLKRHPDVTLKMRHADSEEVISAIERGDIRFGFTGKITTHSSLRYESIAKDEVILVSNRRTPTLSIDELMKAPLILREEGSGHMAVLKSALNKRKKHIQELKVVAWSESAVAIKEMVREGVGMSFLSRYAVDKELKEGELFEVKVEDLSLKREFYLVSDKEATFDTIEAGFLSVVRGEHA